MRRGVICIVFALGVIGCGSDDDSERRADADMPAPTTTAPPKPKPPAGLPRAELLRRMNRICDKANAIAKGAEEETNQAGASGDLKRAGNLLAATLDRQVPLDEQLHALKARPPERDALRRYLAAVKRGAGIERRIVDAARAEDGQAIDDLVALRKTNSQKRITAAIDLGADRCGKP